MPENIKPKGKEKGCIPDCRFICREVVIALSFRAGQKSKNSLPEALASSSLNLYNIITQLG